MLNEIAPRTRPYRDNADQVPGGSDLQSPAFRAGSTFFITCGTSIANQVAFDALAGASKRILVDRTARQSVHIAAGQFSASVDYGPAAEGLSPAGQPLLDIVQLLEMVAAAADPGTPDDTIVLAACSYDGVLYNLHRIMSECLALSPTTAFLVDEAWSAISTSRRPLASDVEARSAWRQHCIGLPRASTRAPASSSTPPRPASVTTRQNDVVYEEIAHVQAKQVPSDCHRSARRRHCPDRSTAFAAAPAHAAARPIR